MQSCMVVLDGSLLRLRSKLQMQVRQVTSTPPPSLELWQDERESCRRQESLLSLIAPLAFMLKMLVLTHSQFCFFPNFLSLPWN